MDTKLIFIISLPRSGSTLLQKILMASNDVQSHAEPWFLLPLIYGMKKNCMKSEYGQVQAYEAIRNLCKSLPNSESDYKEEIKKFALNIYMKLANGKKYFLDKTPRYYFILEELYLLFPDAKFIYIFRNPVSIYASMIESFRNNKICRMDHLDSDLYFGPNNIAKFYEKNKGNSFYIRYEDLVYEPSKCLKKLCNYLDINYDNSMIVNFTKQEINGHGDNLGAKKYKTIKNNKNKWRSIINTRYRKFRLKRFIEKFDDNYLEIGQYSKEKILLDIGKLETNINFKEYIYFVEEYLVRFVKTILKIKSLR